MFKRLTRIVLVTVILMAVIGPVVNPPTAEAAVLPEFFCELAQEFNFQVRGLNNICNIVMAINDSCCDPMGDPFFD